LNLPLDQLQKRLSTLSAMPDAMDIDTEAPKTNGANGTHVDGDGDAGAPEPPPHKSNPASPVQDGAPTPEQAEAFKTLGNKYYKAKEYKKAIEEYTKGT
jgi:DnaJ family protein C protein 7